MKKANQAPKHWGLIRLEFAQKTSGVEESP
jgi:hypothetical protein